MEERWRWILTMAVAVLVADAVVVTPRRRPGVGAPSPADAAPTTRNASRLAAADGHRAAKWFNLFTIVRFANSLCTSQMANMTGTCYTMAECVQRRGSASGTCAAGFGVCCLEIRTCGATINSNSSFFVNPPGLNTFYTANGDCSVTVNKCSANICQLRLDFKYFTLAQPDPIEQVCTQDTFTVSGAANPVPAICGDNTGQHMYLDMEAATGAWTLTVSTTAGTTTGAALSRQWAIAVYQLPCDQTIAAPADCLQYYTGVTGTITSFNFDFVPVPTGGNAVTGRQLSQQDYSMCIRTEAGFCAITYSACPDPVNGGTRGSFLLNLNAQNNIDNARSRDNNCQNDYLLIPGGLVPFDFSNIDGQVNNIFCGTALGFSGGGASPVTTTTRPFRLHLTTDSFENTRVPGTLPAEFANMGFCLNYQQRPCGTDVQP